MTTRVLIRNVAPMDEVVLTWRRVTDRRVEWQAATEPGGPVAAAGALSHDGTFEFRTTAATPPGGWVWRVLAAAWRLGPSLAGWIGVLGLVAVAAGCEVDGSDGWNCPTIGYEAACAATSCPDGTVKLLDEHCGCGCWELGDAGAGDGG